jgi:hypothetical protein
VPVVSGLVLEADVAVFTVERLLAGVRAHVRLQAGGTLVLAAAHGANVRYWFDVSSHHVVVNVVFDIVPAHGSQQTTFSVSVLNKI